MSRHHIRPRCRGGTEKKENIASIPIKFHEAWHILFNHCLPHEAIEIIQIVFLGKGLPKRKNRWTTEELFELRLDIQRGSHGGKNEKKNTKKE